MKDELRGCFCFPIFCLRNQCNLRIPVMPHQLLSPVDDDSNSHSLFPNC